MSLAHPQAVHLPLTASRLGTAGILWGATPVRTVLFPLTFFFAASETVALQSGKSGKGCQTTVREIGTAVPGDMIKTAFRLACFS